MICARFLVSKHTVKAMPATIGISFLALRLSVCRIDLTKRAVCYAVKNYLQYLGRGGEKHSNKRYENENEKKYQPLLEGVTPTTSHTVLLFKLMRWRWGEWLPMWWIRLLGSMLWCSPAACALCWVVSITVGNKDPQSSCRISIGVRKSSLIFQQAGKFSAWWAELSTTLVLQLSPMLERVYYSRQDSQGRKISLGE